MIRQKRDAAQLLLQGMKADAGVAGFALESSQLLAAERLSEFGGLMAAGPRAFRRSAPRSVYLHGPAGRGKSWLMDSFYNRVRVRKRRVHFHNFFRQLHAGVRHGPSLPATGGSAIQHAVDSLLADVDLLCFDEFHVHDVGDAMFISRLLKTASERQVPLVVTSNYPPDGLLPNPLWHEHFVPTILVIKEMMDLVEINGPTDFRRNPAADAAANTTHPAFRLGRMISPGTDRQLGNYGLFPPSTTQQRVLTPTTQPLTAKSAEADLLWISFAELCGGLTAAADYLALVAAYRTWVIDGVPSPRVESPVSSAEAWQRFANVVDVLYDNDVTLFLIAPGPLDWDSAGSEASSLAAHLPIDMARISSRLSLLGRVEAADRAAAEETSGS